MTGSVGTEAANGGCLCGAVRFSAPSAKRDVHACQCAMCRRWTGGPEFAVNCGTDVAFSGRENIATYRSSDWAERAFCRICGSGLYYRLTKVGLPDSGVHYINAGAFDDPSRFTLAGEIYADAAPSWSRLVGDHPRRTRAETEAQFAQGGQP